MHSVYQQPTSLASAASALVRQKHGVEKHYPIAGRGVLIDLAAACGVEAMKAGAGATIADVKQALQRNTMPVSLVSAWMWHAGWPGTCTLG